MYAKSWRKLASSPKCNDELRRTHHGKGEEKNEIKLIKILFTLGSGEEDLKLVII